MSQSQAQSCSFVTAQVDHDLIASIEYRQHQLLVELPEPWHRLYSLSPHFDPKLTQTLQSLAKSGHVVTVNGFAPDAEYSLKGLTRIFYLRARPEQLNYLKLEFLIPNDMLSAVVEQVVSSPNPEVLFPNYRVLNKHDSRDYFICTHGERDHCCGHWGLELYRLLRQDPRLQANRLRVFSCTHIGGHRYAPTLFEVPTMTFWGQVNDEVVWQIMLRSENFSKISKYYRGISLYKSPLLQIAEREILKLIGWEWFQLASRAMHLQENQVTVTWSNPNMEKLLVEIVKSLPVSLVASCGDGTQKSFPQYLVDKVQRIS